MCYNNSADLGGVYNSIQHYGRLPIHTYSKWIIQQVLTDYMLLQTSLEQWLHTQSYS